MNTTPLEDFLNRLVGRAADPAYESIGWICDLTNTHWAVKFMFYDWVWQVEKAIYDYIDFIIW